MFSESALLTELLLDDALDTDDTLLTLRDLDRWEPDADREPDADVDRDTERECDRECELDPL